MNFLVDRVRSQHQKGLISSFIWVLSINFKLKKVIVSGFKRKAGWLPFLYTCKKGKRRLSNFSFLILSNGTQQSRDMNWSITHPDCKTNPLSPFSFGDLLKKTFSHWNSDPFTSLPYHQFFPFLWNNICPISKIQSTLFIFHLKNNWDTLENRVRKKIPF